MKAGPRVVHYLQDEKFTNFFVELIRTSGGIDHHFIVDPAGPNGTLRHTAPANASTVLNPKLPAVPQVSAVFRDCRMLVVHFMNRRAQELTLNASGRVTVFWSGWGGDYYHLMPGGQEALYAPRTTGLLRQLERNTVAPPRTHLKRWALRCGARRAIHWLHSRRWHSIVTRIDLFSAPIEPEFELLRSALGSKFRAGYCQLNYGSVEDSFGPDPARKGDLRRLLLGNSADPVNNHLDAAWAIPEDVRRTLTIVVPVSYGRRDYAEAVCREFRGLGFANIEVMRQFLPLSEYISESSRCGIAIYDARRQHALGNIGAALCQGARVFLNPANPCLRYLQSLGAAVESTDRLNSDLSTAAQSSLQDRSAMNRSALGQCWGRAVVEANARTFLQLSA